MKNFYEISDVERAALTKEDVANAIAYELMRAGILKAVLIEEEKETIVNVPTIVMYVVELSAKTGYNSDTPDVAYKTHEEAIAAGKAMVKGAYMTNTSWTSGTTYKVLDVEATFIIKPIDFADKHDIAKVDLILKENSVIKTRNEEASKKYREAARNNDEISDPIWEKYNESLDILRKINAMAQTLADYIELAGDDETAMKFFVNAHERDDVMLYEEWTGIKCLQLIDEEEEEVDSDV